MARAVVQDPIKAFRFSVSIGGFVRIAFTECTGLEKETEVVGYSEGGTDAEQKSAGRSKYSDITLKRGQLVPGIPGSDDFMQWLSQVGIVSVNGNKAEYRRDIVITQHDAFNRPVREWSVYNSWPHKFKAMSDLKGDSNENSIEELTLCHEGFDVLL
jgi:phage tail-like protein